MRSWDLKREERGRSK